MIAFRKSHPSLCRSRFWREDISWYGVGPMVDLSPDSRSLAFCLHGASQADDDIYVMINAYWEAAAVPDPGRFASRLDKNCGHRPTESRRFLGVWRTAAAVDLSSSSAIHCCFSPIQNKGRSVESPLTYR